MDIQRIAILIAWPGLGLFLVGLAIRWFVTRKPIRAIVSMIGGLVLVVSFACVMWFVSHMFDPVDGKPDSTVSRQGFQSLLSYPPPASITDLQYYSEGFTDHMVLIRFRCADASAIAKIIETLELKPMTEAKTEFPAPNVGWWKRDGTATFTVYGAEYQNLWRYLWVDEKNGVVFFEEASA